MDDPMRFIKAEEFFAKTTNAKGPLSLKNADSTGSVDKKDPRRYAAFLTFDDGSTGLFQFVTPQIWRLRFNPTAKQVSDYPDANSRTIVQNSFADLVDELQKQLSRADKAWNAPIAEPESRWATIFERNHSGWVLSSIRYPTQEDADKHTNGKVQTKAYFRKDPFQIQCTRVLQPQRDPFQEPPGLEPVTAEKVIWQTSPSKTFLQNHEEPLPNNIVLNVAKPGSAQYVGFGEQGGRNVVKSSTFLNYFCFDNYNSSQVYGQGPLDNREPLYHSQPFFLELNGTPGFQNVTATLLDNYSQVFVDLGLSDPDRIALGIRFGILDAYILSADQVPELIWLFTAIVGRPRLKPRFVLGHHQGAYGYTKRQQLEDVVSNYRANKIPLDGLHIDVDFQHKYRTFTTDDTNFPEVTKMFDGLRAKGVKCCTNITPIISFDGYRTPNDPYPTINDAWDKDDVNDPSKNFVIMDHRFLDGLHSKDANEQRYQYYQGGVAQLANPKSIDERPEFTDGKDPYNFEQSFDRGNPYHGGVSYGNKLGIAGYYPDLNREVVRKDFWAPQYKDLFSKGLEFVWQDMTTPAVAPSYGDMRGFPGRLKVSSDPYGQDPKTLPPQKTAIELWALYSYNLHKATYQALDNLPIRANKRNFVIGRGSSTGMHRFAGLWTGDNSSTWDFWRVDIAQVIALGLGGISIAGVDMGGFTKGSHPYYCDPELFIRWYSGAFLLPWYRNHYDGKAGGKLFQEVFEFATVEQKHPEITLTDNEKKMLQNVLPICKYYVRLRYSLMQALYDRMFENLINGLPITRSMLITDPDDAALFQHAAPFIDNQYLLGDGILVCPIMDPESLGQGSRQVYLPRPDSWFSFNLRIDGDPKDVGVPLLASQKGGSIFTFDAKIGSNTPHLSYVTPIFVREGTIIPQIGVRDYVGDGSANLVTLHIYPGKNYWYSMFLDDGVSRSSAPIDLPQHQNTGTPPDHDCGAKGEYREVRIDQKTVGGDRTITLNNIYDKYDPSKNIGDHYRVVMWMVPKRDPGSGKIIPLDPPPSVTFRDKQGKPVTGCSSDYRGETGATVATVPITLGSGGLVITHSAKSH